MATSDRGTVGRRTIRPRARPPDPARAARRPGRSRELAGLAERGQGPLRTADHGRRTTVAADGRIHGRGRSHPGHLATTGRRGRPAAPRRWRRPSGESASASHWRPAGCAIDMARHIGHHRASPRLSDPSAQPAGEAARRAASPTDAVGRAVAAAVRAPSGGNAQPWHDFGGPRRITIALAPEHTSTMDVAYRAQRRRGRRRGIQRPGGRGRRRGPRAGRLRTGDDSRPLRAVLHLGRWIRPRAGRAVPRDAGTRDQPPLRQAGVAPDDVADGPACDGAQREGARLHLLTDAATTSPRRRTSWPTSDRIRYLTPRLHAEMFSEAALARRPGQDSGIDVAQPGTRSRADLVELDILRRPDVMAYLATGTPGRRSATTPANASLASSALAVVIDGRHGADGLRPGRGGRRSGVDRRPAARPCGPTGLAGVPLRP